MHPSNDGLDNPVRDMGLLPLVLRRLPHDSFKIVTKPGTRTLHEAMDQANWPSIWVQLAALLLISYIVKYLFYLANALLLHLSVFQSFWSFQAQPWVALDILMLPFFAFVSIVVLHGMARLLGGQGTFLTMLYTNLLFQVPLVLLTIIISAIPLEGGTWLTIARSLVVLAVQLYIAVLQVFALRAVYGLSQGRAVACILVLLVLSLPLTFFLSILIL